MFPSHFDFLRLQAIQAVLTHRRLIAAASLLLLDFFFVAPPPSASLLSMLVLSSPLPPPCINSDIWFASPISAIKVGLWKSLSLGFGLEHRKSYSSRGKESWISSDRVPGTVRLLTESLSSAYLVLWIPKGRFWCEGLRPYVQ